MELTTRSFARPAGATQSVRAEPSSGSASTAARPLSRQVTVAATAALLVSLFAAFPVDAALSAAARSWQPGGLVSELLSTVAVCSSLTACLIIIATLAVCDAGRRRNTIVLAACVISSAIVATGIRYAFVRQRPAVESSASAAVENAVQPRLNVQASFEDGLHTFPSVPAAVAIAFVFGIAQLFPQGTPLFVAFGLAAALQQVVIGNAYASDALGGAAVGGFVVLFWYHSRFATTRVMAWQTPSKESATVAYRRAA